MTTKIGQDTIYHISLTSNLIYIVVHLSNDIQTFNNQLSSLHEFCETYPDKTVIIMGDFNAIPTYSADTASVKFYSKDLEPNEFNPDNHQGIFSFTDRNLHVSNIQSPTTCKMRILTVQLIKFLQMVSAVIDGIIVVEPNADYIKSHHVINESGAKVFDMNISGNQIVPFEWASDHYVAFSNIDVSDKRIKVGSWNVFGESVDKESFNIFEMATKFVFDKMESNPELESTFWNIIDSQPDIGGKSFKDLYKNKVFSKELRNFNLFNIHLPPISDRLIESELLKKLQHNFDIEYKKMISTATEQQLTYANAIMDLWNQFYNDPLLGDMFVEWFNSISTSTKTTFDQTIMTYLRNHTFDILGLQEVNQTMLNKLYKSNSQIEEMGYTMIAPSDSVNPSITTKTCGVILISNDLI